MSIFSKIQKHLNSSENRNQSAPEMGADCDFSPLFSFGLSDFHSHVLPGVDDGSKNVATSLAMLEEEKKQGITTVLATSHFYAEKEYPEVFLARRAKAAEALREAAVGKDLPSLILGSEVAYFRGMGHFRDLSRLCISGTNFILVEMPFSRWGKSAFEDLTLIRDELGLQPILAHIERYPSEHKREVFFELGNHDILISSNAEFFLDPKTQGKAFEMLAGGQIALLGSDSHNLEDRSPNLGKAALTILRTFGEEPLRDMASFENMILSRATRLY